MKAVFFIITFIFIACVTFTITSFTEIPLWVLATPKFKKPEEKTLCEISSTNYGSINNDDDDFMKNDLPNKVIILYQVNHIYIKYIYIIYFEDIANCCAGKLTA